MRRRRLLLSGALALSLALAARSAWPYFAYRDVPVQLTVLEPDLQWWCLLKRSTPVNNDRSSETTVLGLRKLNRITGAEVSIQLWYPDTGYMAYKKVTLPDANALYTVWRPDGTVLGTCQDDPLPTDFFNLDRHLLEPGAPRWNPTQGLPSAPWIGTGKPAESWYAGRVGG